jgi:hypothetical protein
MGFFQATLSSSWVQKESVTLWVLNYTGQFYLDGLLLNKIRVVDDRPEDRDLILERKVEIFVSPPPPDQLRGSEQWWMF